jgi:hypothetical protein
LAKRGDRHTSPQLDLFRSGGDIIETELKLAVEVVLYTTFDCSKCRLTQTREESSVWHTRTREREVGEQEWAFYEKGCASPNE